MLKIVIHDLEDWELFKQILMEISITDSLNADEVS